MAYGGVAVDGDLSNYQQMIESITEYEVIRLDEHGVIRTWHAGAQRLTGYTADEVLGQSVTIFYTQDDLDAGRFDIELRTAAQEGRYETEGWRGRQDGRRVLGGGTNPPIPHPSRPVDREVQDVHG